MLIPRFAINTCKEFVRITKWKELQKYNRTLIYKSTTVISRILLIFVLFWMLKLNMIWQLIADGLEDYRRESAQVHAKMWDYFVLPCDLCGSSSRVMGLSESFPVSLGGS